MCMSKRMLGLLLTVVCFLCICCLAFATEYPIENAVIIKEARLRAEPDKNSKKVDTLKVDPLPE